MSAQLDEVRALILAGRYVQAAREAEAILARDPDPGAELYHIYSVALYRSGRLFKAVSEAEKALMVGAAGDLAQRVQVNLIGFYLEAGDYNRAITIGEVLLADTGTVRERLPYVHHNLAMAHQARRDRPSMLHHYRTAVRLAEDLGSPPSLMVQIHQQLAWQLLLIDQVAEADRNINAAGDLVDESDIEGQREQMLLACLRAHQTGDLDLAVTLAEEFTPGSPATPRQRTWAALITGWVAVEFGRLDDAQELADRVIYDAVEQNWPEMMNRGNQLRHRISDKREEAG